MPVKKQRIFIIDDEAKIVRLLAANLKTLGYETNGFMSGSEALVQIDLLDPDLILLDVMMPGMDGFNVLEKLRSFSDVPVIILTARDQGDDKVRGLNLGADDYLTKPFSLEEVFARVRAVLRRTVRTSQAKMGAAEKKIGDVIINLLQGRVWFKGQEIRLTQTEYKLFALLAQNIGKVLTHEFLLGEVWGPEYTHEIEYLRVAIARLRQKLKHATGEAEYIKTYPGIGYLIEPTG